MRDADFRCSVASAGRHEDLAGTASTITAFLLLEHPGPWGVSALRDARFPEGLADELRAHAQEAGVRLLLVRRPGRSRLEDAGRRIFAVHARAPYSWTETAVLDDPRQVLDLDLTALRSGRSLGLETHDEPLFAVCTHGRHDACCAERGRPVAAALAAALPQHAWEVSHMGGDRFAANMVVFPDGLYYGRLEPDTVVEVARRRIEGRLELDHLRGRTCYPMPVQAAEIALRRRLGLTGRNDVGLAVHSVEGEITNATFVASAGASGADEQAYLVRVRSALAGPVPLTCRASRDQSALEHEILGITPV